MFTLYNNELKRVLVHPRVGVWVTESRAEADALLDDFHQLVRDMGRPEMVAHLQVRRISEISPDAPTHPT